MAPTVSPTDALIHVFAVSHGGEPLPRGTFLSRMGDGSARPDDAALSNALGAPVDASKTELFAVADLDGMGLRDYLAQAHEADRTALDADAARLDALDGDVLIVTPRALSARADLTPAPNLAYVGAYPVPAADHAARPLPPAEPVRDDPPRMANEGTSVDDGPSGKRIALIVLIALAVAVAVIALV
jgi:hypothetical protein